MKRLLALAAMAGLMAAGFAAPLPAVAAEVPAHCAVLPLLKADCRAAIRAAAADAEVTVVAATSTAVVVTTGAVAEAVDGVTGWKCVRTKGGPSLFSCSK